VPAQPPASNPEERIAAACLVLNAAGVTMRRFAEAGVSPADLPESAARLALNPHESALVTELTRLRFGEREREKALSQGWSVVDVTSPSYPQLLRQIADPPLALYVRGDPAWLSRPAIAIVGSRNATLYGRSAAEALASQLALRGLVITSGFARGIDAAAHRAAVRAGGGTVAVLGCGLTIDYPRGHESLRDMISQHGCLVSEFPLETGPRKENFPRRNRIIAGLSLGVVVVEAHEISGALITARHAAEQGREVFAVPGPADSALSEAPLRLISQGATMVRSIADIWPELPPGCRAGPPDGAEVLLAPAHEKILQLLGSETRSVAELGAQSGLDISKLTQTLFELELQDLVEAVPGQRYAKKSS